MEIFTLNTSDQPRSGFTKSWLNLLAVFGLLLASQLSAAQCIPEFEDGCDDGDRIGSVTIQALGFTHSNTGCSTGAFGDFTQSIEFPDLQAGESYTFKVTHEYTSQNVRVWIDFNDDGVFDEDSNDAVLIGSGSSTGAAESSATTLTVVIPVDTEVGEHRIRIATRFSSIPTLCNELGYGEAHDYLVNILAPNPCLAPTLPMVDGITSETASVSWESAGPAFELEWGAPGFLVGGGGTLITNLTSNSAVITGLDENTSYQYYVRTNCGTGSYSSWVGPISFYTGYCIPPASTYTGNNINNVTTEEGYTNISNLTGTTSSAASFGNFTEMAVLQSAGNEFTYNVSVPSYTNLEIWIDYNTNLIFEADELVGEHVYASAATTFTGTVVIPEDVVNGDYRMRIRSRYYYNTTASPCGLLSYGETEDYTLSIVDPPVCMPPTELGTQEVTMESAILSWESNGSLFDIEYGIAPFVQGDGEVVNNVANEYVLTGLDPDTTYQFYVSTDCGADGNSFWAGPFSFFTGYCAVSTSNASDYISSFSTSGAVANITYTATSQPAGSYANLTSNVIEHPLGVDPFTFTTTYVGGSNGINIWVDWDQDLLFNNEAGSNEKVYSGVTTTATQTGSVAIPDGIAPGTYRMRVRAQYGSAANPPPCGNVSWGSTFDLILEVLPAPSCLPPASLGVEDITQESVVLTWESEQSLFDIEYGQAPFEIGEGIAMNGIANGISLTGLDADTLYQYYVRADCGAVDGISYWSGPYNFFTGYCLPAASSSTGYIINGVSTAGGYTNIMNTTGTTPSTGSYGNFSEDMVVSQSPGGEFTYSIAVPGFTNVEIWADLNQNFIFESDELIGAHVYASSATNFTGQILIPDDLPLGDYRIRVRSRYYFNTSATACGTLQNGETEDYTLSVVAPPACLPPTDLSVEDVTLDSATLVWEADGTLFDIEYGEAPLSLGDGTLISGVTNSYVIENLLSDVNYQYFVRQNCGADGLSLWAGPFTFLTGYCAVSTTNTGDYTSAFSTSGAITNASFTASAQVPGSYSNLTDQVITQAAGLPFNFSTTYYEGGQKVNIWVDWDGDLTFDNSLDTEKVYSAFASGANQTGSVTIPEGTPAGTYRMRVRSQWGSSADPAPCGNVSYGSTLDFTLEVVPAPTCMPPSSLSADNITFETADISWSSPGDLFNIEYGQAPFAVGEGIPVNSSATEFTLTGLDPETTYQYYVRQDCGNADTSYWSGPYSFYTGYCSVSTESDFDYISAFSTSNAVANVTYSATSNPTGAYSNQSQSVIEEAAGESFNFSTTYVGGGQKVKIWIDWNQDLSFDDAAESTERVFNTYATGATQTGSITIPDYTELGTYRMRVRSQWGTDANPGPCGEVDYGTTLDFSLEVSDLSTGDINIASLKLYPNPVADMLHISYDDNITNVEVFNLLGQQVIVKAINASQGLVDMSNLAAGTYLVKVTADKAVKTLKVMKR